jgi:3-deoxy-manno-octulosonate cytidylyltransferase (CMP-KDO synthetase)
MRIVIGIPSRMGSTRFPGKPLKKILNKSMIEHCYERCSYSKLSNELFVTTPDIEIKEIIESCGGNVIMTSNEIERPGLRVAAAAESLKLEDEDIVIVVQGDEPLIHPNMIDQAIEPLLNDSSIMVSNLCAEASYEDLNDPGEIKVVCDINMNALFMSRSPIPSSHHQEQKTLWWKQVCIMPFRWGFMKVFNHTLKATPLELQESVEMNRAIEHGYNVRMIPTSFKTKSVDTDEDRIIAEKMMENDDIYKLYKK